MVPPSALYVCLPVLFLRSKFLVNCWHVSPIHLQSADNDPSCRWCWCILLAYFHLPSSLAACQEPWPHNFAALCFFFRFVLHCISLCQKPWLGDFAALLTFSVLPFICLQSSPVYTRVWQDDLLLYVHFVWFVFQLIISVSKTLAGWFCRSACISFICSPLHMLRLFATCLGQWFSRHRFACEQFCLKRFTCDRFLADSNS